MCNFLLRKGNAVWNLVDNLGLTAADLAWSLNAADVYELLQAEGVRAEMIRAALEAAAELNGQSDDEDDEMDQADVEMDEADAEEKEAEAGAAEVPAAAADDEPKLSTASDNATFLASKIIYRVDERGQEIAEDAEGNGVMMGWERPIMEQTARRLCEAYEWRRTATARTKGGALKRDDAPEPEKGADDDEDDDEELVVVNVGFGLGIIDSYLQEYHPTTHLIIEPHPDVLAHAKETGWFAKPGVRFFEGTWQDYLQALEDEREPYLCFDAVYFDTYSEHYKDLRAFFDVLPNWLRSDASRFSFFHGLGATSRCFYDVYTTVSELHLRDMGLLTEWEEVDLDNAWVWDGLEKRYWGDVGPYRLPVSRLEM